MLQTDILKGLTDQDIANSREKHGSNTIPHPKKTPKFKVFLSQFNSPLVLILLAAGIMTAVLGEWYDTIAILAVVLINTLLGFFQETRAQDALEALKKMITPHAIVIRNGEEGVIDAEDVVVGDIVKIKLGDKVPADGIIVQESNLTISEAVLTGESVPVSKRAYDGDFSKATDIESEGMDIKVLMGTIALSGVGLFKVTRVATQTEFGKIAATLSEKHDKMTPLQLRLEKLSKQIAVIVGIVAVSVFVFGTFVFDVSQIELLVLSVSLAVAAIPEALPIALTVILTVSMKRLLKSNALVRKLIVAETLGTITTICIDKTGTITEGNMRVISTNFNNNELAKKALLAVNQELNAVDAALKLWMEDHGVGDFVKVFESDPTLHDVPFDSKDKYALSVHLNGAYIVGAPEILLGNSTTSEEDRLGWEDKMNSEANKGNRLVAVAHKVNDGTWDRDQEDYDKDSILKGSDWLGYVVIQDPVRSEINTAFRNISRAGVKIKVITGDQKATAVNVMEQAGITASDSEVISGKELATLSEKELKEKLLETKLFYRTTPDQKLKIVEALQGLGEIVAMMGDGVNDAPALKRASVGIAVDNATEVTKETADIVLLDNNVNTIVAAIEEGRVIFENLKKVLAYLLSDSTASVLLVLGSVVMGLPLPLLPLQILYINLVADGLPDVALAFEPPEKGLMNIPPRKPEEGLLNREILMLILIVGVVVDIFIFILYYLLYRSGASIESIRSFIFMLLAVDSLLYVYSVRSLRRNIWESPIFNNVLLNVSVVIGFASIVAAFYVPWLRSALQLELLNLEEIVVVLAVSVIQIIMVEVIKMWFRPD